MDAPHGSVRTAPGGRFAPTRASTPRSARDGLRRVPTTASEDSLEDSDGRDWRSLATFGAGLTIGALLGAGVALLVAPASGFETRMRLARGARHAGERAVDRWETVSDRVRDNARRGRRALRRKMTVSRWRAEDAWDRRRQPREARG